MVPARGVSLPPADSLRLLNLIELTFPVAIVSLVNALLPATRWIMSSGAMTCAICDHIRQPVRGSPPWENTHLGLSEDRRNQVHDRVVGSHQSDVQHRAHSENGGRLDEYGGDGLVQSTDSGWGSRRGTNVSPMQNKSEDNHEGEEDVERERD